MAQQGKATRPDSDKAISLACDGSDFLWNACRFQRADHLLLGEELIGCIEGVQMAFDAGIALSGRHQDQATQGGDQCHNAGQRADHVGWRIEDKVGDTVDRAGQRPDNPQSSGPPRTRKL